jgi:hypothetical protein
MKILGECSSVRMGEGQRGEANRVERSLECPRFKDPRLANPYNSIRCTLDKVV